MNPYPYLLAVLLGGCSLIPAKQADNRQWTSVSCSTYMQFNLCQEQALQVCPKGYDVANVTYSRGEQLRRMDIACKP